MKVVVFCFFLIYINGASAAQRLAVSAKRANIRSGPGTNYEVIWEVEKYSPLTIIKKSGNWYRFKDFEGDVGWIYKRLVKKIPSVITKKENCNIRSGPSTKYDIVFKAERGIPFKVLKRKGNWINVKHSDGDKGWIYKTLVW